MHPDPPPPRWHADAYYSAMPAPPNVSHYLVITSETIPFSIHNYIFLFNLSSPLQLKLYAQRRPASTTVISNDHFVAIAVEDSDVLKDIYHDGEVVGTFISLVFGIPLLLFVLVIVYAKGARWQMRKRLASDSPSSHASLAALTVIALLFSIYVCVLDSAAVWFAKNDNELDRDRDNSDLSLTHDGFLFATVVLDCLLTLLAVCAFIALICVEICVEYCTEEPPKDLPYKRTENFFDCIFCCLFCCALPYGKKRDDENERYKEQKLWLLLVIFVAPIWCIGSHIGYIIIAWISFPTHASAMFSMYTISFVYYFYTLRQFYLCVIDFHRTRLCCKCTHPTGESQQPQPLGESQQPQSSGESQQPQSSGESQQMQIELESPIADKHEYQAVVKKSGIKIWIVALEIPLALFLGLVEVWISYAFVQLPIVEVISEAPAYLFSLASAVLVFISGLIAYKLLAVDKSSSNGGPSLIQFVKTCEFLKGLNLDSQSAVPKTDAEKAGTILAEFLYKLSTDNQRNDPNGYKTPPGNVFPNPNPPAGPKPPAGPEPPAGTETH